MIDILRHDPSNSAAAMRVHLVDGTFELFRAHFTKRPGHTSPSGQDVKASVGVVLSLLSLLQDPDEAATHLAVAFDHPIRSFRNDLYPGYKTDEGVPPAILAQFEEGAPRRRVGLRPEGRAPVREGASLFADETSSQPIGTVTSGGFGVSLNAPIAMGYLPTSFAAPGAIVFAEVRGQRLAMRTAPMPFVPNTYKR